MQARRWLLLAILFLSIGCGGGDNVGDDDDSDSVGGITGVPALRVFVDDSDHPGPGDRLFAGNVIRTDSTGQVSFSLDDAIDDCTLDFSAAVRVYPAEDVLVEFQDGVTTCQTSGEQVGREYRVGDDLTITSDGTLFRVSVRGPTVRIKVFEGVVTVSSSQTAAPVRVEAAFEVTVVDGVLPSEASPSPITLDEFNDFERMVFAVAVERLGLLKGTATATTGTATAVVATATSATATPNNTPTETPTPPTEVTPTQPPDPPTIELASCGANGLGLSWDYTDGASEYLIFRSVDGGSAEQYEAVESASGDPDGDGRWVWCDEDVDLQLAHCYYVSAVGEIGQQSAASNEECQRPPRFAVGNFVEVANTGGAGANLRSDASTSADVISALLDGTTLEVIGGPLYGEEITWWEVTDLEGVGYIDDKYLELADLPAPTGVVVVKDGSDNVLHWKYDDEDVSAWHVTGFEIWGYTKIDNTIGPTELLVTVPSGGARMRTVDQRSIWCYYVVAVSDIYGRSSDSNSACAPEPEPVP